METLTYDCLACGRCCFAGENYIEVFKEDLVTLGSVNVAKYVVGTSRPVATRRTGEDDTTRFMKMTGGHCAALDPTPGRWACTIYGERPLLCHVYEPGSVACLKARARPTQQLL